MVALVYSDADSTKEEWSFPNHKAGSGFILTLDYVVPSDYFYSVVKIYLGYNECMQFWKRQGKKRKKVFHRWGHIWVESWWLLFSRQIKLRVVVVNFQMCAELRVWQRMHASPCLILSDNFPYHITRTLSHCNYYYFKNNIRYKRWYLI